MFQCVVYWLRVEVGVDLGRSRGEMWRLSVVVGSGARVVRLPTWLTDEFVSPVLGSGEW